MDQSRLVFVCGALRSGTTLLRLMLREHPLIANPGEMDFLFELPSTGDLAADAAEYRRSLSRNRIFLRHGFAVDETLGPEALSRSFVDALDPGEGILSINIHRHFDVALRLFPQARFIHLLRDPRDVARSSIGMGWAGHVYYGAKHWVASERSMQRVLEEIDPARLLTVRNEDLVRATEAELGRICRFLGIDYDSAMMSYPAHSTYGPPDASLVEQWRRKLTPREAGLVEARAGDLLTQRGYAPSGHPNHPPARAEAVALWLRDRWGRYRERVRQFGPWIVFLEFAAQRLKVPALLDHVAKERGAIEMKLIK